MSIPPHGLTPVPLFRLGSELSAHHTRCFRPSP
uniref:Uncharacterized protein n=1 Tax=Anguilla anguilla TaxID=7936 RepID=A0A0E9QH31_ANGAN